MLKHKPAKATSGANIYSKPPISGVNFTWNTTLAYEIHSNVVHPRMKVSKIKVVFFVALLEAGICTVWKSNKYRIND